MIYPAIARELYGLYAYYALLFIFLYTALDKIRSYDTFIADMQKSVLIPAQLVPLTAGTVIASELLIAGLLLHKKTRKMAFLLAALLMLLFTGYILLMLNFSPYLPCSCGGFIQALSWPQHLAFNSLLLVSCVIGFLNEE
ncbi:MauE/DoxX family redox-associated membrane protein [Hymenobacter arcticus]